MVSVVDKPSITEPAVPKSTVKVYETGENKLVCIADGNPPPTFTWKKGSETITKFTTKRDTQNGVASTLTLSSISKDSTGVEYVCTASNPHGSASVTIELQFGGK